MKEHPFHDPKVEAVFAAYPANLRKPLTALRRHILDTARATPQIGEIVETLKWGEPAYLPKKPRTGTTVRINAVKGSQDKYGMYFHCQTTLMDQFRVLYPESFAFEGNRALIFSAGDKIPLEALRHCIALALTYHLRPRG